MNRLFPTTLALLLVMSSLGHTFAASFCPHASGRECCFAKASSHTHALPSSHENTAMPMDDMQMEDMHGMQMEVMQMDATRPHDSAINSLSPCSSLPAAD